MTGRTVAECAIIEMGGVWRALHQRLREETGLSATLCRDLLWMADCDVDVALRLWREMCGGTQ